MDKLGIKEIKKTLSLKDICLDKFVTCYVGNDKEIISRSNGFFTGMDQNLQLKYMEIFKKVLSGKASKNLYSLGYTDKVTEQRDKLLALKESELTDGKIDDLFKEVINTYECAGRYIIIVAYGAYDIPQKASDGTINEDGTDVYSFIISAVCPVELVREGLVFNEESHEFEEKFTDWAISKPTTGFLYPAFNGRQEDSSEILYYTKSEKERQDLFAETVLGVAIEKTEAEIQSDFQNIISTTFGRDCDFDAVKQVTEIIKENIEEAVSAGEQYVLDKPEFRTLVKRCGADEDAVKRFEEAFDETMGGKEHIVADTVIDKSKILIKSDDLKLDIKTESSDIIETRMIEGREYIILPITNNLSVNGIPIVQSRKEP